MINHIYSCQIIAANGVVLRVDLRAAMFSIPSCAWVDSSGRLFHNLSRKHAGKHVSRIMRETSWDVEQTKNRLAFPAKTTVQI